MNPASIRSGSDCKNPVLIGINSHHLCVDYLFWELNTVIDLALNN